MTPPSATEAKVCACCGEEKPRSEYRASRARKCNSCVERAAHRKCVRCGVERHEDMYVFRGTLCQVCKAEAAEAALTKRCWTCGKTRPADEFTRCGRRCSGCWEQKMRAARCAVCGSPAGLKRNRQPRKVCRRPECFRELQSRNARVARQRQAERLARRTTKRCPVCCLSKPRTEEYFSPIRRDPATGAVTKLHSYCRVCFAALQRDKYHAVPAYRAYAIAKAKQRSAEEKRRRREDPEFDAEVRAQKGQWDRARRARQRLLRQGQDAAQAAGTRRDCDKFGALPAEPLSRAVYAEAGGDSDALAAICHRAGIHERQLYAWAHGEIERVQFDTADRVITRLGLLWFDVYEPGREGYEDAARAFAGEAVAA